MNETVTCYRVKRKVREEHIPVYEEAMNGLGAVVDITPNPRTVEGFELTAFIPATVDKDFAKASVLMADTITTGKAKSLRFEELTEGDVAASHAVAFEPLEIGSFYIYSGAARVPEGKIPVELTSGLAFGTGEHPTTAMCLDLYEKISQNQTFRNGLDMGCGSAVLSIAAAKKDAVPFLGVEIEKEAAALAHQNVELNGVESLVEIAQGNGFEVSDAKHGSFDLIFANILLEPLLEMAGDIAIRLQKGGVVILSGYLEEQRESVITAYQAAGLALESEVSKAEWQASAFRRQ